MKLTLLQSDKGDCLLVTTANGQARMLIDGGMGTSYRQHVAPYLEQTLTKKGTSLDVVYVSHVDDDHISGVLQLMDDLVAWRVFDHQTKTGNPKAKQPTVPRPPNPVRIWHNAFHEQLGENAAEITNQVSAIGNALASATTTTGLLQLAHFQTLALSKAQAIELTRRVSPEQLNVKLNPEFKGKLMMVNAAAPVLKVGGARALLLGPFPKDVGAR